MNSALLLQGTWKGRGRVLKATGEVVAQYLETATIQLVRQTPAFVVFTLHQDTQHAEITGKPMHTETGFLKIANSNNDDDTAAVATLGLTHPFPSGMVQELSTGTLREHTNTDSSSTRAQLTLTTQKFTRLDSQQDSVDKKQVTGFKRVYRVIDTDKLQYDQYMAVGEGEMYHHLHCEMEKV